MSDQPAPGAPVRPTYQIVASGAPVDPHEVETHVDTIEVVVMWGDDAVLHVDHVPPSGWAVGDKEAVADVQFAVGEELLGLSRLPVIVPHGEGVAAVVPEGATGTIDSGKGVLSLETARAEGNLDPCPWLNGAHQWPLTKGTSVTVVYRGLTFVTRLVPAGRKFVPTFTERLTPLGRFGRYFASVSALAALFLVAMYLQPPTGSGLHIDYLDGQDRLVHYAVSANELRLEPPPDSSRDQSPSGPEGPAACRRRRADGG